MIASSSKTNFQPTTSPSSRAAFARQVEEERKESSPLLPLVTLVIWWGCLVVGVLGFVLPYARPRPPAKQPAPIQAEVLSVELTNDPLPELGNGGAPAASDMSPPPPNAIVQPSNAPPMIAVAVPSPAIAFALPVEAPTRVVEAKHAAYYQPAAQDVGTATTNGGNGNGVPGGIGTSGVAQPLTFGYGDGKQPAPDYPRRSVLDGQEGTVVVRFSVGENGRVVAAEAVGRSPWHLLNEEAVRTVRERWRFRAGAVRLYEVSIRFELKD